MVILITIIIFEHTRSFSSLFATTKDFADWVGGQTILKGSQPMAHRLNKKHFLWQIRAIEHLTLSFPNHTNMILPTPGMEATSLATGRASLVMDERIF